MTWKTILGAAGAFVVVGGVAAVLTGFGPGGCGRGHGLHGHHDPAAMAAFVENRVEDALDDLDATPEQRERIQAVVKGLVAEAQALRSGHQTDHAELLALWNSASPDAARLHAMVDERSAAMTAFAHKVADAAIEIHGILTPEQRAQVARKHERRMGAR